MTDKTELLKKKERKIPTSSHADIPYVKRGKIERQVMDFIRQREKGTGALLLISGASGAGKNRLIREMMSACCSMNIECGQGMCMRDFSPPYEPLITIARDLLLRRSTEEVPPYDSVLSTLLGERGFRAIESEDPNRPFVQEHQILESFGLFFSHITRHRPLVIHLEELQWADESTLRLLEHMISRSSAGRLGIIASCADEHDHGEGAFGKFRERLTGFDCVKEIKMPPLTPSECGRLLSAITGAKEVPAEFAEALARQSRGNPLYVIEAMRNLIPDSGALSANGIAVSDPDNLVRLIDNLFELIITRIVELPEALKELYRTAACIGRRFSFTLLQEAMGKVQNEVLLNLLEKGRKQGFHLKEGESFIFSHPLYRDAFYELVPQNERKSMHGNIGTLIEELYFNNLVEHFEELILHFREANDDDRTIRYMIKVADKSALAGAYKRAVAFYEEALAILGGRFEKNQQRWKCFRNLGIIHLRMGDGEKALQLQMKALDIAEKKKDISAIQECLYLIADIHMETGDIRTASEMIETALGRETMRDTIWKCKLMARKGKLAMLAHYKDISFEDAILLVRESFSIAQELRNVDGAIESSDILAEIYSDQNMEEEAERALAKILRYRTSPEIRLSILEKLGRLFVFPGSDLKKACDYLKEGLDTSVRMKHLEKMALFASHLGDACCQMGDLDRAMQNLTFAIELQTGGKGLARTYGYLADLYFKKGNLRNSRKYVEKALKVLPEAGQWETASELDIRSGHIELLEGNLDAAREHFTRARESSRKQGFFKGIFFSLLGMAEIYLREGNLYSARLQFVEASRGNKKGKNWCGNAHLSLLQGIGFRLDQSYELSLTSLSRASEIFEKLNRPYEIGMANLERGRTCREMDECGDAALQHFEKAKKCFSGLGNKFMVSVVTKEMKGISH